ncbi:MAG TPA: hypothetical protein DIT64_01955 [Verrucomicrobiales bacterium]|nr:hypothetical protein [Verrucomicrobiales bacterium]HCN78623.1 hypothetical protein [Verrucomicrobiales bacterium]HRJ07662.1 hypothetical protein [Prosthecobacter sp.]HRK16607.1 hypothetical protein [Prosthecobacter sp.]
MKAPALLRAALCLTAALIFTQCASPVQKRIQRNPEIYARLSETDKLLVQQGRLREGMTREAVFLSWGRPDQVASGSQRGAQTERWTYLGAQPVYTDTWNMGWGWGGRGWGRGWGYGGMWDPFWGGYGSMVTYVPYKAASVSFRGGRVTEFLRGPQ